MKSRILSLCISTYLLQADVIRLEDVTVTATRLAQAKVSQALSIEKKDSAELALDQVVFQKDLLNSLSNVLVTQTTSGMGHMISVRTPISTNPYFLYLQDGLPVQSSGFFNHNALAYTSFESADNVEVLKGAGTALYGSDAVAAVINLGSKKPDGKARTKVKTNIGSYGYTHASASNSGTLAETTNYHVHLGHSKSHGYRDHTAYKRDEFNAKFFSILDEENTIETSLNYNKTVAEQAGSLTLDELESGSTSVGDIKDKLDKVDPQRKFDFARASIKWDNYSYDNLDISSIAYIRDTRNRYIATWQNNLPSNDSEQKTIALMEQAVHSVSWGKNIYGLDMEYTKGNNTYTQSFAYVPSSYGSAVDQGLIYDYDVDYTAFSPYMQSSIELSKVFSIEAGLRFDKMEFDYTNNTEDGQYGNSSYYRPANRSDSFSHLSPKLSLHYHPNDKQLFYARYANGFRIPSSSRLYSQLNASANTVYTLDPETSNTYELGYKQVFRHSTFYLAYYSMYIDDTIIPREAANKDRYYENGGKSKHQGVEMTYKYLFNEAFSTALAASYSESNYVNDAQYSNNEIAAAPKTKANLRVFYTPSTTLSIMAEVHYVSAYYMDDKNTHEYEGYTVSNIKANYTLNKHLKFFGKIDNISDEKYAEKAEYSYGREKYTPASPRMFYLGAEYSF